jgi:hypothetical protein
LLITRKTKPLAMSPSEVAPVDGVTVTVATGNGSNVALADRDAVTDDDGVGVRVARDVAEGFPLTSIVGWI